MQNRSVYITELYLTRPEATFKAALCFCFLKGMIDYKETIQYLHAQEADYFDTLKFEKRIKSYLMGRFVAKQAVAALTGEENLTDILIKPGVFTQPIIVSTKQNIQVSITHCDDFGAALAFPEAHPMGIDLEKIDPDQSDVLERQLTNAEKDLISSKTFSYETGLTLLWTVKEALSKVLKTGLMTPFEVFEVSRIEFHDDYVMCFYRNFAQYKGISFMIGSYVCSIVHPLKTEMCFDIRSCKENYAFINF